MYMYIYIYIYMLNGNVNTFIIVIIIVIIVHDNNNNDNNNNRPQGAAARALDNPRPPGRVGQALQGKMTVSAILRKTSANIAQKNIKILAREFPNLRGPRSARRPGIHEQGSDRILSSGVRRIHAKAAQKNVRVPCVIACLLYLRSTRSCSR